jgi:hypothetical protein
LIVRKNITEGLTYTITSYPKFRCVEDLVFLRTINSWQLGLSDYYNTQQVVANLNWGFTSLVSVVLKQAREKNVDVVRDWDLGVPGIKLLRLI